MHDITAQCETSLGSYFTHGCAIIIANNVLENDRHTRTRRYMYDGAGVMYEAPIHERHTARFIMARYRGAERKRILSRS